MPLVGVVHATGPGEPLRVAAIAPLSLARCSGSYGAHHPGAHGSHLV
jgi:hypothetical protein